MAGEGQKRRERVSGSFIGSARTRVDVVEHGYRLTPAELRGLRQPVEATITSVSVQGLERLTLVVHLDRFAKPLALNSEQRKKLVELCGNVEPQQWVGQRVALRTERQSRTDEAVDGEGGKDEAGERKPSKVSVEQYEIVFSAPASDGPARADATATTAFRPLISKRSAVDSRLQTFLLLLLLGLIFLFVFLFEGGALP